MTDPVQYGGRLIGLDLLVLGLGLANLIGSGLGLGLGLVIFVSYALTLNEPWCRIAD